MKNKIYYLIIITYCFISCGVSKEIKNNYTYKYKYVNSTSKSASVSSIYHLYSRLITDSSIQIPLYTQINEDSAHADTFLVFYEDGMFALSYNFSKMVKDKKFLKTYWNYPFWGTYKKGMNGILKVQCVKQSHSFNDSWDGYEIWFQLIGNERIKTIMAIRLYGEVSNKEIKYNKQQVSGVLLKNIEIPPNSNAWIKKQKWFWQNESDWEEYMSRKTKKRIK